MNKKDLMKNMLVGFLPIFVFMVADELWGTKTGLIVAIAFGLAQFGFTYFYKKEIDKMLILDTLLLVAMGGISIVLDNDLLFKLKPALIEAILCIMLGVSAFSGKNLVLSMSKRYMKDVEINDFMLQQLNRMSRILFYVILAHTLLIVYAAYFMSKEAWVFISGGLFYIIFGGFFVFEFAKAKLKQKGYFNSEEMLPLVDEEGNLKGSAPRSVCHQSTFMLHPVIHLHIISNTKGIFLQKRSETKLVQPGKWDTAVGGHIAFGETIDQTLERETEEELGLKDLKPQFVFKYIWKSNIEQELIYVFVAEYSQDINVSNDEVSEGKYWSFDEIRENKNTKLLTPNFVHEYDLLVKALSKGTTP